MFISLKSGRKVAISRIVTIDGDRVTYLDAHSRPQSDQVTPGETVKLSNASATWMEGTDSDGNRSLLSLNQICVIRELFNPDNMNDMTPAYVAETRDSGPLFLSREAVAAIVPRLVEQWGDLAEQPKWMG